MAKSNTTQMYSVFVSQNEISLVSTFEVRTPRGSYEKRMQITTNQTSHQIEEIMRRDRKRRPADIAIRTIQSYRVCEV